MVIYTYIITIVSSVYYNMQKFKFMKFGNILKLNSCHIVIIITIIYYILK